MFTMVLRLKESAASSDGEVNIRGQHILGEGDSLSRIGAMSVIGTRDQYGYFGPAIAFDSSRVVPRGIFIE